MDLKKETTVVTLKMVSGEEIVGMIDSANVDDYTKLDFDNRISTRLDSSLLRFLLEFLHKAGNPHSFPIFLLQEFLLSRH